jgi:hypothetical protein
MRSVSPLSLYLYLRNLGRRQGNRIKRANDRCKQFFNHPQPRPSTSTSTSNNAESSKAQPKSRGRGIGSDKNPLDMAYYDVLGLDSQCTQDEIKKAYRRLAIKVSRPLGRRTFSAARLAGLLVQSDVSRG